MAWLTANSLFFAVLARICKPSFFGFMGQLYGRGITVLSSVFISLKLPLLQNCLHFDEVTYSNNKFWLILRLTKRRTWFV